MPLHSVAFGNYYIPFFNAITTRITINGSSRSCSLAKFESRAFLKNSSPLLPKAIDNKPSVVHDSLRLLEWDKLCDSVASFAGTSSGKQATKAQLWTLNQTYEESMRLLGETNAAVEMHNRGGCAMDFSGIDVGLVKSAVQHAQGGQPVDGSEAMATVALLLYAETLQYNLRSAIKEDAEWYQRFMPLSVTILELVISRSVVKLVQQLIDEDGSVKDSASSALKRSRDQVRLLERKLYQLVNSLVQNKMSETSILVRCALLEQLLLIWDITYMLVIFNAFVDIEEKTCEGQLQSPEICLFCSGSGGESIMEPLSAVPLNDELQQAKALVAKAEADVLLKISEKMRVDIGDIEKLLNKTIELDVINARATYSLSFGGTCPDLFLAETKDGDLAVDMLLGKRNAKNWTLHIPKAYHPLLLQQHRQKLRKARKDVTNATSEIGRRNQGEIMNQKEETDINLSSFEMMVTKLEQSPPIPVDIFVAQKTRVLVITGPNTGGKTLYLKTIGLAAVMAKSGLYVLSSEPVKIPWFDSVLADIGDEQSLSQSLSTFSGHLRQINEILKHSTSKTLVLLDEVFSLCTSQVGAGTNPLEGAALGISLLESLAESGPLLTIATTHHGELKTLKYSNDAFENACMEFDEVNLKPTYRILWGVPGRSNAIKIAERLGLPNVILGNARELYGAGSAEINEVIFEMERLKQNLHKHVYEGQNYLKLSRDLHENLLVTRRKVMDHGTDQRYRMMQQVSEMASMARSILHKKRRQIRASATRPSQPTVANNSQDKPKINSQDAVIESSGIPVPTKASDLSENARKLPQPTVANNSQDKPKINNQDAMIESSGIPVPTKASDSSENARKLPLEKQAKLPKVGDTVHVSCFNKEATVLKVEPSKEELLVQVGQMKLKLKLADVTT
ncbi:hypothetical protein RHSIM_Rhsim03G0218100 [Rhododendron simsii]|uniref:DNA mismatch repair proteins mutS family domain-containing protein n=1 Tax=Rhododendron simsii TaxID=118357 RepID=A0A834H5D8_RHOSS|nr:hypothetical protein RHSIM_Rhsim03G0218100 [Rhododendron simsii]